MKIHGLVYVVLGILMALYSRFIQSRVDSGALVLFFWIGVFFVGFGIFRLVIGFVLKEKKSEKKSVGSDLEKLKLEKDKFLNKNISSDSSGIVSCSRCGTRHYKNSNFCHMCGYSLK